MKRAWVAVALSVILGGCASWSFSNPFGGPATMLAKADRLTAEGDYRSAVAAYDANGSGDFDSDAEVAAAVAGGAATDIGVIKSFECPVIHVPGS